MNANRALWEKGDFTEIAGLMSQSGAAVVQSLGITPPVRVLDLGCGERHYGDSAGAIGADVVGIDIARNLVDAGNKRAVSASLTRLRFQEGDACNLIWCHVRAQAVQCCKRDGPGDETGWPHCDGQLDSERSEVCRAIAEDQLIVCAPAAGRLHQPDDLGRGVSHHRAFWRGRRAQGKHLHGQRHVTTDFIAPDKDTAQVIGLFRRFYGPTMNAFEAAEKNGREEELHNQLLELAKAQNQDTTAARHPCHLLASDGSRLMWDSGQNGHPRVEYGRTLLSILVIFAWPLMLRAQASGSYTTQPLPINGFISSIDAAGNIYFTVRDGIGPVTDGAAQTKPGGGTCYTNAPPIGSVPGPCSDAYVGKADPAGNIVFGTVRGGERFRCRVYRRLISHYRQCCHS